MTKSEQIVLFIIFIMVNASLEAVGPVSESTLSHASKFVILITSYNNERYAQQNLDSTLCQKSTWPFRVIYVNDCSTDKTGNSVDTYVSKNNLESKVTVIHNRANAGGLKNYYDVIHGLIDDDEIVVCLDGDDYFAHDGVLLTLEKYYSNPDIWLTYGSLRPDPIDSYCRAIAKPYPSWVFTNKKIREYKFYAQHLKTFIARLFKKIKRTDLVNGEKFMTVSWDLAIMFPMLEMCSPFPGIEIIHATYVPEVLYVWRADNPLSDFRLRIKKQKKQAALLRAMPSYAPLEKLL
jgi:glycosyltransferase involved in cell wall biosynthesis